MKSVMLYNNVHSWHLPATPPVLPRFFRNCACSLSIRFPGDAAAHFSYGGPVKYVGFLYNMQDSVPRSLSSVLIDSFAV
jgi:hypothetical protein